MEKCSWGPFTNVYKSLAISIAIQNSIFFHPFTLGKTLLVASAVWERLWEKAKQSEIRLKSELSHCCSMDKSHSSVANSLLCKHLVSAVNNRGGGGHYENLSFGRNPHSWSSLWGFSTPRWFSFVWESRQKSKEKHLFPIWRSRQRRLLAITFKRNDDNSCDLTQQCK